MNQFSRKELLSTAGISTTSSGFIKAEENPSELESEATTEPVATANICPQQIPEATRFRSIYIKNIKIPS